MGTKSWWPYTSGDQVCPDALPNGLILSGGGARAAYQVGVLMGIAELVSPRECNPFPIVCGTSAGAINAAGLAARAHNFRVAVRGLERTWRALTPEQIFHTNLGAFLKELVRWALPAFVTGTTPEHSALLNNAPLAKVLASALPFQQIQTCIDNNHLRALSVTASSYSNNESVTFFQGAESLHPWQRARRRGQKTIINIEHLLASSALPVLFQAQKIGHHYYGDGAMRQLSPISPALHLGARRVLVIGVSGSKQQQLASQEEASYPSMAQVLGHVLDSVFVDTLEGDVERLERINQTITLLTPEQRAASRLREVEVLKIYPSQSIDEIAAEFLSLLPWRLRLFLRGPGGTRRGGAAAVSYLLFEKQFINALIELGLKDARRQKEQIRYFLRPGAEYAAESARA